MDDKTINALSFSLANFYQHLIHFNNKFMKYMTYIKCQLAFEISFVQGVVAKTQT